MKKLALTFCGLALTTAFVLAADYHLVQMQMQDEVSGNRQPFTVYTLFKPDKNRAMIFKEFGSEIMEGWLTNLPPGSVVYYEADKSLPKAPQEKVDAMRRSCAKHGIKLIESNMK